MDIPLFWHLFIHFFFAILSGYLAGYYFKNIPLGIMFGFMGGFLIDLDHVLEYLLVFNGQFNLQHFFDGRQFLFSEQLHLWFHAWEHALVLLLIAYFFRRNKTVKIIVMTLAFAGTIHLISDCIINRVPPQFYSLSYRASRGFAMKNLMTPEVYQINQKLKLELGM